ncbi:hypothetical protein Rsub_05704 [Raphidocelis subcapitata]|uniref:Thioredoxin domain-containing protein n=1 Tax=Raphidocelis subcapitata TaxID=307507 RepID=A0A2V0P5F0_9CHLO|nr:hypothetical protein Rsub_05704 [Raphidocelis subcapitata]|eukprot:GBF93093.1 hypothetical protein Rsub_05704 [Raphidocelis subcapitata]
MRTAAAAAAAAAAPPLSPLLPDRPPAAGRLLLPLLLLLLQPPPATTCASLRPPPPTAGNTCAPRRWNGAGPPGPRPRRGAWGFPSGSVVAAATGEELHDLLLHQARAPAPAPQLVVLFYLADCPNSM